MEGHPALAYTNIVQREARKLLRVVPTSIEKDDLIQVGLMALMEAHGRWKPDGEASMETWLTIRVKGAMIDWLRGSDSLPRSVREKVKAAEKARQVVEQRVLREPRSAEVAAELGIDLGEYHRTCCIEHVSLEQMIFDIGMREDGGLPIILWNDKQYG